MKVIVYSGDGEDVSQGRIGHTNEIGMFGVNPILGGPRYMPLRLTGISGGAATTVPAINTLFAHPFMLAYDAGVDRLAMRLNVSGGVGSLFRFGIYSAKSIANQLLPDALMVDSGQFDGTVVGQATANVSLRLKGGVWYWATVLTGVGAPTFFTYSALAHNPVIGLADAALDAAPQQQLSAAQAYGALPAAFPVPALDATTPALICGRFTA